jgi:hypothetical protein
MGPIPITIICHVSGIIKALMNLILLLDNVGFVGEDFPSNPNGVRFFCIFSKRWVSHCFFVVS